MGVDFLHARIEDGVCQDSRCNAISEGFDHLRYGKMAKVELR